MGVFGLLVERVDSLRLSMILEYLDLTLKISTGLPFMATSIKKTEKRAAVLHLCATSNKIMKITAYCTVGDKDVTFPSSL